MRVQATLAALHVEPLDGLCGVPSVPSQALQRRSYAAAAVDTCCRRYGVVDEQCQTVVVRGAL